MIDRRKAQRIDRVVDVSARLRIEHDEPTGNFHVKSTLEKFVAEDDRRLDNRLSSRYFREHQASTPHFDLGWVIEYLRTHVADSSSKSSSRSGTKTNDSHITPGWIDPSSRNRREIGLPRYGLHRRGFAADRECDADDEAGARLLNLYVTMMFVH